MGRRGTKPRPVEQLRVIGSKAVYDRVGEPAIVTGDPDAPEWLSEAARKQWDVMVARLRGMQVLSAAWRESLAQFCQAWAEYEELVQECKGQPRIVMGSRGPVANPLFRMRNDASDRAAKYGLQFGNTPASKASLRTEEKPQSSGKSRFFKG